MSNGYKHLFKLGTKEYANESVYLSISFDKGIKLSADSDEFVTTKSKVILELMKYTGVMNFEPIKTKNYIGSHRMVCGIMRLQDWFGINITPFGDCITPRSIVTDETNSKKFYDIGDNMLLKTKFEQLGL
jgi:hypothetical protein